MGSPPARGADSGVCSAPVDPAVAQLTSKYKPTTQTGVRPRRALVSVALDGGLIILAMPEIFALITWRQGRSFPGVLAVGLIVKRWVHICEQADALAAACDSGIVAGVLQDVGFVRIVRALEVIAS